jgi:hypothetical protein
MLLSTPGLAWDLYHASEDEDVSLRPWLEVCYIAPGQPDNGAIGLPSSTATRAVTSSNGARQSTVDEPSRDRDPTLQAGPLPDPGPAPGGATGLSTVTSSPAVVVPPPAAAADHSPDRHRAWTRRYGRPQLRLTAF